MKRPPGIWLLLSAGVLWISLQDVYGIRATALIFGKSPTTTTTEASASPESSPSNETASTESSTESVSPNATKPTLTGIPQVDYIWDPNLPKELNGYNLSAYPFYERVPEDIDFKCDGLHDGFYASVPHKCQVYHHCLFGTRYDFLCANYTAFDQKTFICHFVSEVDCVNSKKYWHRNDALYKAASTTTAKPVVVYTPPPVTAPATPPPPRPGRRRPARRRRPQYDYYEYDSDYDYYEDRPRPRRRRPRPRPRPLYDYEEEYEDEMYERRGSGRRNEERNRNRRPERRRNKDRRRYEDEEDEDKLEDERKVEGKRGHHKRRPVEDEEDDRRRNRPKLRPVEEDYEEEPADKAVDKPIIKPTSGSSLYDRPRAAPKIKPPVPKSEANKYAYKPMSTKPPPIEDDEEYYEDYEDEPVKNHRKSERHTTRREETRDTRKQMARLRAQSSREDSAEEETPRRPFKSAEEETSRRPFKSAEEETSRRPFKSAEEETSRRPFKSAEEETSRRPFKSAEEETPRRPFKPKYQRPRANKKPVDEEYEEYEEEERPKPVEKPKEKPSTTTTSTTTTTTTTTTTPKPVVTTIKEMPKPETIVRIVKRPFLPSRGGNPYAPRGLQPVGAKAVDKKPDENSSESEDKSETMEVKPIFKPSPVIIKMPFRQKYSQAQESQEDFKPVSHRPQVSLRQGFKPGKDYSGPRTTQKPKLPELDPLDIEDEYDVTLNDALNPTLPNLPVRSFPTGFSNANDYNYRPRYVIEAAGSDYVYQHKPARQRFQAFNGGAQFVNSDADYKGQYSTLSGQSYRPRVTQAYYSLIP